MKLLSATLIALNECAALSSWESALGRLFFHPTRLGFVLAEKNPRYLYRSEDNARINDNPLWFYR